MPAILQPTGYSAPPCLAVRQVDSGYCLALTVTGAAMPRETGTASWRHRRGADHPVRWIVSSIDNNGMLRSATEKRSAAGGGRRDGL